MASLCTTPVASGELPVDEPLDDAALREAAKKTAVLPEEALQFIEGTGDYMTKLNNEKEHKKILAWLKEALRLAYLSPALKESIKRLLAVNNFTANMSYMQIFEPLQEFCQNELLQLGEPSMPPLQKFSPLERFQP